MARLPQHLLYFLGSIAPWLTGMDTRVGFPLRPEMLVRSQQPGRHVRYHIFALLGADRLGAHLRVCVVIVAEHHHGDQAPAVLLVVHKLGPSVVPHAHAPHEPASPVVAVRHAGLGLQQKRHIDLTVEHRTAAVFQWRIMSPRISFASSRLSNSWASDISPPKTSG